MFYEVAGGGEGKMRRHKKDPIQKHRHVLGYVCVEQKPKNEGRTMSARYEKQSKCPECHSQSVQVQTSQSSLKVWQQ